MGEIAARLSNLAILTSDNPRTEDPLRIIAEVEAGLKEAGLLASRERARMIRAATSSNRIGAARSRSRCGSRAKATWL